MMRLDPRWFAMPVGARGLALLLRSYADEAGHVALRPAATTGRAVAILLGAQPAEHRRVERDLEVLVAAGFARAEGGVVELDVASPAPPASVQAVARDTPKSAAERAAAYRARKRGAAATTPTEPAPVTQRTAASVTDVTPAVTDTVTDRHVTAVTGPLPGSPPSHTLPSLSPLPDSHTPTGREGTRGAEARDAGVTGDVTREPPASRPALDEEQLGDEARHILAALRAQRSLAAIATARFADHLAGVLIGSRKTLADVTRAIADAGTKAASVEAADGPLTRTELAERVTAYIDFNGRREGSRGARVPRRRDGLKQTAPGFNPAAPGFDVGEDALAVVAAKGART
jgi:hypothetical protein